jgi:DNA-binding HxlR family transcriptional regulator
MKKNLQQDGRSDCPVCMALERIGDAWSLLIVRGLMLEGRHSFNELLNAEEGIASNILSDRLHRLEAAGIIGKLRDPKDARRYIYRLTEKGIDLAPVLLEMILWAAKHEKTSAPASIIRQMTRNRDEFLANIRNIGRSEIAKGVRARSKLPGILRAGEP